MHDADPFAMVQPWLVSSDFAIVGLYGNGSPCFPVADR